MLLVKFNFSLTLQNSVETLQYITFNKTTKREDKVFFRCLITEIKLCTRELIQAL